MAALLAPGGSDVLSAFATRRRTELYGSERRRYADDLINSLRQSHVFKVDSDRAQTWNTTTSTDFKKELVPASDASGFALQNASQQLEAHFKLGNGGGIGDEEEYRVSKTKADYKAENFPSKPHITKREFGNNWADVDPKRNGGAELPVSTYADIYKYPEDANLERPHYGKKDTSKLALPLPLDNVKAKISVSLGSENLKIESDYNASFADPQSTAGEVGAARETAKLLKVAMEYGSNTFREGDYNGLSQQPATTFGVDYNKEPPSADDYKLPKFLHRKSESADAGRSGHVADAISPRLPRLIGHSMQTSQAQKEGADGKKYHTRAHFAFGHHGAPHLSVYGKDYPQPSDIPEGMPRNARPLDTKIFDASLPAAAAGTSYGADYGGLPQEFKVISADAARKELAANVEKSLNHNARLHYNSDGHKSARQRSLFAESYRKPSAARMRTPAKERRAKFDLLRSDGAMAQPPKGARGTENKENFRNWNGVSEDSSAQAQNRALKLEALRRLKSGRRSHYSLGYARLEHGTENREVFRGKPKDDDNTPAAGLNDKDSGRDWKHMAISDNTVDTLADPQLTSRMESLTALETQSVRRVAKPLFLATSVTKSDFIPTNMQQLTAAQVKQNEASSKASKKPQADSHFFHTDTSGEDNYQTTSSTSYIRPELMTGKIHL